jgi:hypothetical protein
MATGHRRISDHDGYANQIKDPGEKTGPTPGCRRARRPFLLEIEAHS